MIVQLFGYCNVVADQSVIQIEQIFLVLIKYVQFKNDIIVRRKMSSLQAVHMGLITERMRAALCRI